MDDDVGRPLGTFPVWTYEKREQLPVVRRRVERLAAEARQAKQPCPTWGDWRDFYARQMYWKTEVTI